MMERPNLNVSDIESQKVSGEDLLDLVSEAVDKHKRGESLTPGEMEALKAFKVVIEEAERSNTQ